MIDKLFNLFSFSRKEKDVASEDPILQRISDLERQHEADVERYEKLRSRYDNMRSQYQDLKSSKEEEFTLEKYITDPAKESDPEFWQLKELLIKQEKKIEAYSSRITLLEKDLERYESHQARMWDEKIVVDKEFAQTKRSLTIAKKTLNETDQKNKQLLTGNKELIKDKLELKVQLKNLQKELDTMRQLLSDDKEEAMAKIQDLYQFIGEAYGLKKVCFSEVKEKILERKAAEKEKQKEIKKREDSLVNKGKTIQKWQQHVKNKTAELDKEIAQFNKYKEDIIGKYPYYQDILLYYDEIKSKYELLSMMKEELEDDSIVEQYDLLVQKKDSYDKENELLMENMKKLEEEKIWLKQELKRLKRQENKYLEQNVDIQSQLYAEIEKNEQVLFIIRSLNWMNPLYEKVMEGVADAIRGEKSRRIVSSYLRGESFYEIALREGLSISAARRVFLRALFELNKRLKEEKKE